MAGGFVNTFKRTQRYKIKKKIVVYSNDPPYTGKLYYYYILTYFYMPPDYIITLWDVAFKWNI